MFKKPDSGSCNEVPLAIPSFPMPPPPPPSPTVTSSRSRKSSLESCRENRSKLLSTSVSSSVVSKLRSRSISLALGKISFFSVTGLLVLLDDARPPRDVRDDSKAEPARPAKKDLISKILFWRGQGQGQGQIYSELIK